MEFIPLEQKEFIEYEQNVDEILSKEELIEKINEIQIDENKYYKIILTGKRNFEIDQYEIQKYINHNNIVKIKDYTTLKIDINEIAKQNNLKGIFTKNMLQKLEQEPENEELILKALEIGLEAM